VRYIVPVAPGGGSDLVGRFGKYIQADSARWTALVKAQNLHIDA
jgi:tripartite-type tricarboxylate transporter receptor subunit TctC